MKGVTNAKAVVKAKFGNRVLTAIPTKFERASFLGFWVIDKNDSDRNVYFKMHRESLPEENPNINEEEVGKKTWLEKDKI